MRPGRAGGWRVGHLAAVAGALGPVGAGPGRRAALGLAALVFEPDAVGAGAGPPADRPLGLAAGPGGAVRPGPRRARAGPGPRATVRPARARPLDRLGPGPTPPRGAVGGGDARGDRPGLDRHPV